MARSPEYSFSIGTDDFVAIRTWDKTGTSKHGYGASADEAIEESRAIEFDEAFGSNSVILLKKTTKSFVRRKATHFVYEKV